jgi:hypothetical protein
MIEESFRLMFASRVAFNLATSFTLAPPFNVLSALVCDELKARYRVLRSSQRHKISVTSYSPEIRSRNNANDDAQGYGLLCMK